MKYVSTRGQVQEKSLSEAVLAGIAPDGGLFYPEKIPSLNQSELQGLLAADFADSAAILFKKYNSKFSDGDILSACHGSYNQDAFSVQNIVPLRQLDQSTFLLELFHGPTGAFKDFALQFLPRLMRLAIAGGDGRERCILVATSGDTGGAALSGFADVPGTSCLVFFPRDGVSHLQAAQMRSAAGRNVSTVTIDEDFDAAQAGVKMIFADADFATELREHYGVELSSANSINIGRLLPQLFYVFAGYAHMVRDGYIQAGEKLDICVPTGNFGNMFSAYLAKKMGLPLGKLICASNHNDTSVRFLQTGCFDVSGRKTRKTLSPAMDILRASNLERLLFDISGNDSGQVCRWQQDLQQNGRFELDRPLQQKLQEDFSGLAVSDDEVISQIRQTATDSGYVVDPHTAVGLRAVAGCQRAGQKCLVFSTAHYGKFGRTVHSALFPDSPLPADEAEVLRQIAARYTAPELPEAFLRVLQAPLRHHRSCAGTVEAMKQEIRHFFEHRK